MANEAMIDQTKAEVFVGKVLPDTMGMTVTLMAVHPKNSVLLVSSILRKVTSLRS